MGIDPAHRRGVPHRLPVREVALLPIQPVGGLALGQIAVALRSRGVSVKIEHPILRPPGSYDELRRQLKADVLLARVALSHERPVLGVTDADCYAGQLNFVFGTAEVGGGIAVASLYRLRTHATTSSFMERAMKEIFHELGHATGLRHCENPHCVMHFSNSLAETDAKDEELCLDCLRRVRFPRGSHRHS